MCPDCKGSCQVPKDPDRPFVSTLLKEGQLFFPTYHPAYLFKKPGMREVIEEDFARIEHLRDELEIERKVEYVSYPEEIDSYREAKTLSVDIENEGRDPDSGRITIVGFSYTAGKSMVLSDGDSKIDALLRVPRIIGANYVLHDAWWLWKKCYPLPHSVWDTRFAGHLLNPDTPNDLPYCTGKYAKPPARGYWKTRNDYRDNLERVCCIDTDMALRVEAGQREELERKGQLPLMEEHIIPLSSVLLKMRTKGMRIDTEKMGKVGGELDSEVKSLRAELPDWGGVRTEGQAQKIQKHLYEKLGLPVRKKRGTDKITADKEALVKLLDLIDGGHRSTERLSSLELEEARGFIHLIQTLRAKKKLWDFFQHPREWVNPELNPAGTATLRLSCNEPNVQQIPPAAREIFIPDEPGWKMMSVDIKQAEVVSLMWYTEQWEVLRAILIGGHDAHKVTASLVYGVPIERVTPKQRKNAKTTTFAIIYGEAPQTTAIRNDIPLDEVMKMRAAFFKGLPGVEDYRQRMVQFSMRYGYVESPFGVRRYIRPERPVGHAANQVCNAPIQNIPAMVTRNAMIKLDRQLPRPARMLTQVHDEILLSYPAELEARVASCVRDVVGAPVPQMPAAPIGMASGLRFGLDIEVGEDWGHLECR